jgi:hypothetical protein
VAPGWGVPWLGVILQTGKLWRELPGVLDFLILLSIKTIYYQWVVVLEETATVVGREIESARLVLRSFPCRPGGDGTILVAMTRKPLVRDPGRLGREPAVEASGEQVGKRV